LPVVFALFLALAAACGGGEAARDFEVEMFDGVRFRLSEEYAENVVIVNFWYPSCAPCREEMPEFQQAWEELDGEQVRFLGVFVPRGFDTEQTARDFVDELGLTFDFATDREETIATAYGVEFYPTTWFIGRDGRVAEKYVSALDAERITSTVRDLLDG
jgi:peroxiredoxin